MREAGLLEAVEVAVMASGGHAQDARAAASEWSRDNRFICILAKALDLEANEVDKMFRNADTIKS